MTTAEDVEPMFECLDRALAELDQTFPRAGRLAQLRFHGSLTIEEGQAVGLSPERSSVMRPFPSVVGRPCRTGPHPTSTDSLSIPTPQFTAATAVIRCLPGSAPRRRAAA